MIEIAHWRPPKNTALRQTNTFRCSAIVGPLTGHMGITGTLGVKEAGCGQRTGHLIGGMGQRAATVEFNLSVSHIVMSV
jgi:hypothetical protein